MGDVGVAATVDPAVVGQVGPFAASASSAVTAAAQAAKQRLAFRQRAGPGAVVPVGAAPWFRGRGGRVQTGPGLRSRRLVWLVLMWSRKTRAVVRCPAATEKKNSSTTTQTQLINRSGEIRWFRSPRCMDRHGCGSCF